MAVIFFSPAEKDQKKTCSQVYFGKITTENMDRINLEEPNITSLIESDSINDTYPQTCLPKKLSDPTTEKGKSCLMEAINPNIYDGEARMVAFRTTQERIFPWLKILNIFYFELYGKQTDEEISWVDSLQSLSLNQTLKSVIIDKKSKEGKLMYKVTFFLRSGLMQCQGNRNEKFMHNDFPQLLELVKKITGSTINEKPAEHDQQKVDTTIKQISCPNDQQETDTLPKQSPYSHKHLAEAEQ